MDAPGKWAKNPATTTSQAHPATAGQAMAAAAAGHRGATRAARIPQIVTRGTMGAARMLAGTDHTPTLGCSRMRMGVQAAWATSGRATVVASQRGRRRESTAAAGRWPRRMPAVAATDRAKP